MLFQNRPNALQGIAPNARRSFRQGQHNQRFCNPQCKDDFHNEANQEARQWQIENIWARRRMGKGKYVVVPPAPGREWLNNLPVAEAPEELKQLVRTNHTHMDAGMDFLGPPMSEAIASSSKVPKTIYFLILRLMPKAERRDQRRAAALFIVVALKRSGRNNTLNYCAWALR